MRFGQWKAFLIRTDCQFSKNPLNGNEGSNSKHALGEIDIEEELGLEERKIESILKDSSIFKLGEDTPPTIFLLNSLSYLISLPML